MRGTDVLRRLTTSSRVGPLILLGMIVVGALLAIFVPGAAEPVGVVFLVYGSLALAVVVHECGHCIAALLFRFAIVGVQFGNGPRLMRFRVAARPIDVRLLPFRGFVFTTRLPWPRSRTSRFVGSLALALGGVIANAVVIVIAVLVGGPAPLSAFLVFGNVLGVLNLIPMSVHDAQDRPQLSDGAQVIAVFQETFG